MTNQMSSNPDPWLSILIPVYNVRDYLAQCLDSILSQNPSGVEIILVDDCSTDTSPEICGAYAQNYPDIVHVFKHAENCGLSTTRNTLLQHAKGTYIWWIDSDDFALPGSLNGIKSIVNDYAPDLILVDYLRDETTHKKSFYGEANTFCRDQDALIRGVFQSRKMYCWQKISRRELWDTTLQFPDGKMFEDITVTPKLLAKVNTYFYWPEPAINYRIRQDSLMGSIARTKGSFDIDKHDDLIEAMNAMRDVIVKTWPAISPLTEFYVSHFIAREYIKVAKRYKASDHSARNDMLRFKSALGDSSPIAFKKLLWHYMRKGRFVGFYNLARAMRH